MNSSNIGGGIQTVSHICVTNTYCTIALLCTYRRIILAHIPQYECIAELKIIHSHICVFPNAHTCSAYYPNHRSINVIASTDGITHT
jgi:hypothetical protein